MAACNGAPPTSAKPFPWRKLTPAQIALMEHLAEAGGSQPYGKLSTSDLAAFEELGRLKLVDMRAGARRRLDAVLTDRGAELRAAGYRIDRILLRITKPQMADLRFSDEAAGTGRAFNELPGPIKSASRPLEALLETECRVEGPRAERTSTPSAHSQVGPTHEDA